MNETFQNIFVCSVNILQILANCWSWSRLTGFQNRLDERQQWKNTSDRILSLVVEFWYILILVKLKPPCFVFYLSYFIRCGISLWEHIPTMDRQLINIILLGIAFMTLFIAFQTTSLIAVQYHSRWSSLSNFQFALLLSSKVFWREWRMKQGMALVFKAVATLGNGHVYIYISYRNAFINLF